MEGVAKRIGGPRELAVFPRVVGRLQVPEQRPQVLCDRAQFRRLILAGRPQQAFAPHQRAQALHPSAPAQLRDDHRDERDDDAQAHEEVEQVLSRLRTAALDETRVVDEHQRAGGDAIDVDGSDRNVKRPLCAGEVARRRFREPVEVGALDLRGEEARRHERGVGAAEPHREEALVLREAGEELREAGVIAGAEQVAQLFLGRVRDEARAQFDVPDEPLLREPVDERHQCVRERGERKEQRNDEPEREPHCVASTSEQDAARCSAELVLRQPTAADRLVQARS